MQHTCQDCDHKFFDAGQSQDSISPAVQCPQCHSYRTQPGGIPNEANDMLHGLDAMPTSTQDDMSGNPLQEGMLGGYQNSQVRDNAFSSVRRSDFPSMFESPEFETTQIVAPPDLYRDGMKAEQAHQATLQIPKGVTDNLHAALGNLQAWVESPAANGRLQPYDSHWKAIRPSYMKPGALRIGVADPTMAEILNHVANTDDLTPLYQYRGKRSSVRTAGPALALLPEGAAALLGGGAADAAGAGAVDAVAETAGGAAADAATSAGASEAGSSASGVGGVMNKVMKGVPQGAGMQLGKGLLAPVVNYADDVFGFGGGQGGGGAGGGMPINDASFYSRTGSDEDDAFPSSHGEIPKNEDGDHAQQDDGNQHEWQRDISINDGGGTDHSPSFENGSPGMERFKMLLPLLMQMINNGEDGSNDPLVKGLHDTLEGELPGYRDHGDDGAADHLLMILSPSGDKVSEPSAAEPDKQEETHTDENSGGKHESKVASLQGDGADFLPDLTVIAPFLRGAAMYPAHPADEAANGYLPGAVYPEEEALDSASWPQAGPEHCPYCGYYGTMALGMCPGCHNEVYQTGGDKSQAMEYSAKTADTQGPQTPEQIQAVQQWIMEHGHELGLEGDELIQTVLAVPTNPLAYADVLAQIQHAQVPSPPAEDAGMSANPPMPAQENAPPGATMPVPGMDTGSQMMAAVRRYAADSVASQCPHCKSHTTELLDDEGNSSCHSCHKPFKSDVTPKKLQPSASTWNVDEDLRKEADAGDGTHDPGADPAPVQGVPMADQQHQRDLREEQDSGHTWLDEGGNPLTVGQEYEMFSDKFDIPDLIRIEAVKSDAVVYTITGEFGIEHSTELTKQEANIEGTQFKATQSDGELTGDQGLEENNDDNTGYTGSPERTDMSAPSGLVASVIESGIDRESPHLSWLMQGVSRTAGASYTPMEQRSLIDEMGMARNADRLDLSGTHYIQDAEEDQFLFGF